MSPEGLDKLIRRHPAFEDVDEAFLTKLDSLFEMDSQITGENVSADISGLIGQNLL